MTFVLPLRYKSGRPSRESARPPLRPHVSPDTGPRAGFSLDRNNLSADEARLLPHLRQSARGGTRPYDNDRRRMVNAQAEALREAAAANPEGMFPKRQAHPAGGDRVQLRGIPVQAPGVSSVSPHTQPEAEVVRRERAVPEPMRIRRNPQIRRAA